MEGENAGSASIAWSIAGAVPVAPVRRSSSWRWTTRSSGQAAGLACGGAGTPARLCKSEMSAMRSRRAPADARRVPAAA